MGLWPEARTEATKIGSRRGCGHEQEEFALSPECQGQPPEGFVKGTSERGPQQP